MNTVDWKNLSDEHYIIAGLALLCLILIIILLVSKKKNKDLKRKAVADQIDLEESGKHEKWFSVFTKTVPQVFWIRSESKTHFVSPHFEDLTGHSEKIVSNFPQGILNICHPEDLQAVSNAHSNFFKHGSKALDIIFRIKKSGSLYIWIRERVFVHRHFSGEKFFVGVLEDITEKQLITEEINDQRHLLNNILASTDEGIFCLDRNFKFIYWNKEMESITGIVEEEIKRGETIFEIFPHLLENGASDRIKLANEGKHSDFNTYAYHFSNNRKGFTDEKYLPLANAHGETIGVIGIVKDISEELARETILEKTQERYGLTLRAVNDGIWDWNITTDELIFSDRWFTMLGYTETELSSSRSTLTSLLATEEDQEILKKGMDSLKMGKAIDVELRMTAKSGEPVWVLIRGKCIETDADGKAVRAIGTQTDINRRKNFELDLIDAKEKAVESDRLKSAFLANMSHEIRTPLNAIVGFTDLLTSDESPTDSDKKLGRDQIRKNSDNLLSLINDIILLSTIESGQYCAGETSFDLVEKMKFSAKKVYKKFGPQKADTVGLKLQIPPGVSSYIIHCDENLLETILLHLLKNALMYTQEGQVTLGYKLLENNSLEIFVRDTGVGIKKSDLTKIFKQFEQLEAGMSRNHEGTGLGLTLTNKITEFLGGEIQIESEPDKGSCFSVIIPCQTP